MEAIFNREIIINKTLSRVIAVAIFAALTALGAFIRIPLPFTPIPLTMQTFFVLLCAAILGANLGAAAQVLYVCVGLLGIPIFSGAGSGLTYLFGPSGGYLFGFIFASIFIGSFIRYCRNSLFLVFLTLCLGDLILLCCGAFWLKLFFGYTSLINVLYAGIVPFLPGDLLKIAAAVAVYFRLRPAFKRE